MQAGDKTRAPNFKSGARAGLTAFLAGVSRSDLEYRAALAALLIPAAAWLRTRAAAHLPSRMQLVAIAGAVLALLAVAALLETYAVPLP